MAHVQRKTCCFGNVAAGRLVNTNWTQWPTNNKNNLNGYEVIRKTEFDGFWGTWEASIGNSRNKTTNLLYTCMNFSDNKENIKERELFDLKGAFDQEIKVSAFDVY